MKLKIGSLYSYHLGRTLHKNYLLSSSPVGYTEANQAFMLLETKVRDNDNSLKVLNAQGVVGWMRVGYLELLIEMK